MSGTGISQGSVSAFGSIFVNGIEWNLAGATIEVDGVASTEADLRLGMVVRIDGEFDANGTTGTAASVVFDDSLEGPIEADPVETTPGGPEKTFTVLGRSVRMNLLDTAFDDGASFAGLVADDVVEVSGFIDNLGTIQATRIQRKGQFPGNSEVELRETVSNLVKNPNGSGDFDLGTIMVHYLASTSFFDLTRASLANGDFVETKGSLRITGNEIDANEIEMESAGLGGGSANEAEIEGFVSNRVSNASFEVNGTPVDASMASFEPVGFIVTNGDRVEVEGRLENGILIADRVESEDADESIENVRIEAAVSSIDPMARELTILGVTVTADGKTHLADDRDGNSNFAFSALVVGDWLDIRGVQTGAASSVVADRIERQTNGDCVLLEGPVDSLDVNAPTLSVLGQAIPLDGATSYFDADGVMRTEEQFFRNPGDVILGDIVRTVDQSAADLAVLGEADEVSIESD